MDPKEVQIQQSWDETRRETVDPAGKQHTSIYYYPGFFRAKLIIDGEIKKQSEVYIPTNGWKTIVEKKPLPVYLSPVESAVDSGWMGVNKHTLEEKTGSSVFSDQWVGFFDVREFPGINGDHFFFRTTLRNTSTVEQSLCRNMRVIIMGKENPIVIPLADKGCISSLGLWTGFAPVNGKDHDLSAFGCDCSKWQQLTCTQEKGSLNIWVNDQLAYTVKGNRSIGDIVGLRIAFEGTGDIKEVTLKGNGNALDLLKQP
jgi:hypothetical protein